MKYGWPARCLTLLLVGFLAGSTSAEEVKPDCLEKDSISCLQTELFRGAKELLERDRVELWGGLSLDRTAPRGARKLEEKVVKAEGVKDKETALEEYVMDRASAFLQERSITLNLAEAAKSITQAVAAQDTEEGRGKKKKLLRSLLPILIGIKMKLVGFLVLSYFVIALIAKKALLASLISLAISGFIAIKKLMSQQHHHTPHHEVHEVAHGWVGPSYGGGGGGGGGWDSGFDSHGAYSNSVAHSIAYPGQKPSASQKVESITGRAWEALQNLLDHNVIDYDTYQDLTNDLINKS